MRNRERETHTQSETEWEIGVSTKPDCTPIQYTNHLKSGI